MSLNKGEVNPLGVLGLRKLSFIPEHFSRICVEHKINVKEIEHWIEYNLNSRYSIKRSLSLDQDRKITTIFEIAVEDPKEITMLSLGCHHLYKNKG